MALSDGLNLVILLDNSARANVTSISVNGQSGQQAIETLDGLAGFSDGSQRVEIDIEEAVLLGSDQHLDVIDKCANGEYVDMQLPAGIRSLVSRGKFDTFTLGQSTGNATNFSAKFIGEFNATQ